MPPILLEIHSYLRYFILIMLVVVIARSLYAWSKNQTYTPVDNKLSLYLLIFTHLQLVAGLIVYFVSPLVQFNNETMKNDTIRYWTVEHIFGMLVGIVLITVARTTSKRMSTDLARHRRLAVFNSVALVIIVGVLAMGGRGIIL
jgi:hypothetical protein